MKYFSFLFSIVSGLVIALSFSNNAHALHFLDAEERAIAEQEYSVESIEQIDMRNKALFTEYYLTRPDQYGPYPAKMRPVGLTRLSRIGDQRRYPAFLPVQQYVDPLVRRTFIPLTSQKNVAVQYEYHNRPITESNKLPGITFYNNFSAYDDYVQRW